ncbi:MAG: BPSS1780 family membrane protein [Xanthomonadales bacterium]|nr:BPSS1780 family membrane protein [Xanthomonadales bacterium]
MKTPAPVEPRRVPAAHGMAWLVQTLSLLRRQAGRLLFIALLMQLVLGLTQIPLIGLLVVLSVPGLSAGLLEAFHVAAAGGRPALRTLFVPLASGTHNGRLLALGALVFAVGIVSMSLLLSGSGELMDPALLEQIERGDLDAIASINQEALGQMALAFLLGVSISGTISYFAIPLIWFRQFKLGAALVTGLRALFINWLPFLVLGLGLLLVVLPVAVIIGILFSVAGSGSLLTGIVMGLIMVLLLLFQLLLFGTQYCAFRDIFGLAAEAEPPVHSDNQLLA